MRIHLIAIGGAAMHNIAIALKANGHHVTGSDDEIYDPAREHLESAGLLPKKEGWFPKKITQDIDTVILGMHAKKDNPELLQAQSLGLTIMSYPEFIYEHSKRKQRLVIAGSHGKTTSVAMAMHCLKRQKIDFDYLVGAPVEGFDNTVRLSDAPVIVIEGDEYSCSALDPTPKMCKYRPHHVVVTGIAWDHYNVYKTFEEYKGQFAKLIDAIEPDGNFIWLKTDEELKKLVESKKENAKFFSVPFEPFPAIIQKNQMVIKMWGKPRVPMLAFGEHNLINAKAGFMICRELGVWIEDYMRDLATFKGAGKRLQSMFQSKHNGFWIDFAHSPSKLKATIAAVKTIYPERRLVACYELHTFSSLNKEFLPQYKNTMDLAETACIFYNPKVAKAKNLPELSVDDIKNAFDRTDLHVFTDKDELMKFMEPMNWEGANLLMMSSGNFDGFNYHKMLNALIIIKAKY